MRKNYANQYDKSHSSLFEIKKVDKESNELKSIVFEFDTNCIHERDMSDFFKYMY